MSNQSDSEKLHTVVGDATVERSYLKQRLSNQVESAVMSPLPPFPSNIMFELNNACNHKCRFCYNREMERKHGVMKPALFERLAREAYDSGAREIGFATTGEPLLHYKLFDFVRLTKEIGYRYTYFSTNGGLLTTEKIDRLFDAGLDSIKFSINAGTPETYLEIHGKDNFEHVLEMVKYVDETRKLRQQPMKLLVTSVVTPESFREKEVLQERIGSIVDDLAFFDETGAVGPTNSMNLPLPCHMLFNRLHITWEGFITTCCVDYENNLVVADLNSQSMMDGWHSFVFQEFRKRHLAKDVSGSLCQVCLTRQLLPYRPLTSIGKTVNADAMYDHNSHSEAA